MTDPWSAATEALTGQLAELAREDPDPEVLEQLQDVLESLRPALSVLPPGADEAWAERAREVERLTLAVAEAAMARREELNREQRHDHWRARGLAAYGAVAPVDARFLDRRS